MPSITILEGEFYGGQASYRGRTLDFVFYYAKHPAAGSLAFPGLAVWAHCELEPFTVSHTQSERGDEYYITRSGPEVLDPGESSGFGISANGATLQEAFDDLEERIAAVRSWCDEPWPPEETQRA